MFCFENMPLNMEPIRGAKRRACVVPLTHILDSVVNKYAAKRTIKI